MKRESRTVDRSHQVDSHTERHLPLVDFIVDTRAELMELAVASGLKVLHTMLEEIGPRSAGRGISIRPSVRRRARGRSRVKSFSAVGKSRFADRGSEPTAKKSRSRRFARSPTPIR